MDKHSVRLFAVDKAIDLAKSIPTALVLSDSFETESILEDAEAIEKYILGYEPKAEQE